MKAEENVQRSTLNVQRSTLNPPSQGDGAAAAQGSTQKEIRELFEENVVPSYARFDVALEQGEGSYVWDVEGRRYLDLAGGIAVCSLGHAHPEITAALAEQSQRLVHISNLYYNKEQGRLARRIVELIAPGRVFFCNSGAEANEGLFKLARKFGHDQGRYEIITTHDSFHGRTLAGIAATGQEKVKKGFDPPVAGFKHVPFNDLEAMRAAIKRSTVAILIEPIQGESGITIATPEYLLGLRKLCDEHNLLLLFDEVQAGHFRTGKFQSWQRILEETSAPPTRRTQPAASPLPGEQKRDARTRPGKPCANLVPDAVSMAKGLGGGFPIGAFWVREKFAEMLSAGSHASTFGGSPLGCAVALRIFDVIKREDLATNAERIGGFLLGELRALAKKFPQVLRDVRGFGLMIGLEFEPKLPVFSQADKSPAIQIVNRLHQRGVLTVPAATSVIRLLPALNLDKEEAEEGVRAIEQVVEGLKS